jgi:hypothetical protein
MPGTVFGDSVGAVDGFYSEVALKYADEDVDVRLKVATGGSAGANQFVNLINPDTSNIVRIFYDEVLLPYSHDDWRCWLYGIFKSGASGDLIHFVDNHAQGTSGYLLSSIERLGTYPFYKDDDEEYVIDRRFRFGGDTGSSYTMTAAAKLADEMFRRTTVDVKFNKFSGVEGGRYKGKRRVNSNQYTSRRTKRNLTQLAYILEYYLIPEAARRISEEDLNRYSTIVQARQNMADFRFNSTGVYSVSEPIQIHVIIKSLLEAMRDAAQDQLSASLSDTDLAGAHGGNGPRVRTPSLGISKVVSNESVKKYKGPAADRDLAEVFADPETSLV